MTVPEKWRTRVAEVGDSLPDAANGSAPAARKKAVRALAHSNTPVEDIKGIKGLTTKETPGKSASYNPWNRSLNVSPSGFDSLPFMRADLQRSLTHEVGHHVQNRNLNKQQFPVGQYAEATAENYADKYAGSFLGHTAGSGYDDAVKRGRTPNGWEDESGMTPEASREAYSSHRKSGVLPDAPFDESVNGRRAELKALDRKVSDHAFSNGHDDEYIQASTRPGGIENYARKYGLL